ncbi:hypothetical protein BHE74_00019219 [Ensete ventricosum]|nr:hypothetical protein GW17_00034915 [Ensete ventricosum]RWW72942.1 hypothetical protein BHE74_00019219 [Ensete ventricosum]RZR98221.1 hypothetical protein BHM03_00027540 [Ensete ventricosum]
MSVFQSRAERIQWQLRKPGRPGSSGQQRSSVGGGGGGGSAPPPIPIAASPAAPSSLSANRRVNPTTASEASGASPAITVHRAVQNGAQASAPSPDAPAPGSAKPMDMLTPRNASRAIPKAPSSQSATGASSSSTPLTLPKAQAIATYNAASQMYYPPRQQNSYSPSSLIFTTTSVSLTSGQVSMSSQAPRYSYSVSRSGQNLPVMQSTMVNNVPVGKPSHSSSLGAITKGINSEEVAVSTSLHATIHETVKPSTGSEGEKVGASLLAPPVVISMPVSKAPKSGKTVADSTGSCQRNQETSPDGPARQLKSGSKPLADVSLLIANTSSTAAASVPSTRPYLSDSPAADSGLIPFGPDGRKREPVQRSYSLKDTQKKQSKKEYLQVCVLS